MMDSLDSVYEPYVARLRAHSSIERFVNSAAVPIDSDFEVKTMAGNVVTRYRYTEWRQMKKVSG